MDAPGVDECANQRQAIVIRADARWYRPICVLSRLSFVEPVRCRSSPATDFDPTKLPRVPARGLRQDLGATVPLCYVCKMPVPTIQEQFGQIDIYLFDQVLKGRISPGMRNLGITSDAVPVVKTSFTSCGKGTKFTPLTQMRRRWRASAPSPGCLRPRFRSRISQSKPSNICPSPMRARM